LKLEKRTIDEIPLLAPTAWWKMNSLERLEYSNGCGPKTGSGLLAWLIPDRVYGLLIRLACDIHDYCWAVARTQEDFEISDEAFRFNLFSIIESVRYSFWKRWLLWLRSYRATSYYRSVREVRH